MTTARLPARFASPRHPEGRRPFRLPAPRRGVALLTSIVAMLLVALMAVGIMHVGRGDFARSRDEAAMRRAVLAADAGAYDVLRRWPYTPHETLAVGGVLGPDTLRLASAEAVSRTVRTSRAGFWTTAEGRAGDSVAGTMARRSVQVAYRLALPDLPIAAALSVRDSLTLAGSARVVGTDTSLAAWAGQCPVVSHVAGVAMPDTTRLCDGVCGAGSVGARATGAPPLLEDSVSADTARYRAFGSEHWGSLARHAAVVLPGGSVVTPAPAVAGGHCDRTRSDNWGAPGGVGPCAAYAPLIWAAGDLEMRGGEGQGLLLVQGDLTLSAGARFAGVVLVRDDLRTSGAGGVVLGGVLAEDAHVAAGDHTRLEGSTLVQHSRCAIELALERSARLVPVRHRAWAAMR